MSDAKFEQYLKGFKKHLKDIKDSEPIRKKYLQHVGVLDKEGNHTEQYNECIRILAS